MRGSKPTIQDVELDLHELVMPANLLSDESLSPDTIPEEELKTLYKIDVTCGTCSTAVRLVVGATNLGIRHLEELLLSEVDIICAPCARRYNGRQ